MSHDALRCMLRESGWLSDRAAVGKITTRADLACSSGVRLAEIGMVSPASAA